MNSAWYIIDFIIQLLNSIIQSSSCSVAQLCSTLYDPMYCSLPWSAVHEIFQARILEWVAISYFMGGFQTQGLNPYPLLILYWQANSLPLHHLGNPNYSIRSIITYYRLTIFVIFRGIRVWEMLNVRILITMIYCLSHVMANTLLSLFHFVLRALSHSIVFQYIYWASIL